MVATNRLGASKHTSPGGAIDTADQNTVPHKARGKLMIFLFIASIHWKVNLEECKRRPRSRRYRGALALQDSSSELQRDLQPHNTCAEQKGELS